MFKRGLSLFLLLICCQVIAAKPYHIEGLSGDTLENSQKRLDTLLKHYPQPLSHRDKLTFMAQAPAQINEAIKPFAYFKAKIRVGEATMRQTTKLRKGWRRWVRHGKAQRKIIFTVTLGPQIKVTRMHVSIIGSGKHSPAIITASKHLAISPGQPLLTEQYEKAKQQLFDAAEHSGYLRPKFIRSVILIDLKKYTSEITLEFNTGRRFYFSQVSFDTEELSHQFLRRFLTFKPGDPYSTDKLLSFNEHLNGSGYFQQVHVSPKITSSPLVPINVHTKARPRKTYALGLGFGTDTGPRGKAALNIIPVNRQGHKFQLLAQGSIKQNQLRSQYIIPGNNPVIDQFSIGGGLFNLDYTSGHSSAFQVSLAQIHKKEKLQRTLAFTSLYERTTYTSQQPDTTYLLYPNANFNWLHRDSPLFSPNMYNVSINGLSASRRILSDINLSQAMVDLRGAYFFKPTNTRLYAHAIQGGTAVNNITDVPLSIAFLLGGTDTLKAYGFNSIGPGKIISFASGEIQQQVKPNWFLIGFYEVGDVYDNPPVLLKRDSGLALMWVSPIGPIKAGVAQAVNSRFRRIENAKPKFFLTMGPDL